VFITQKGYDSFDVLGYNTDQLDEKFDFILWANLILGGLLLYCYCFFWFIVSIIVYYESTGNPRDRDAARMIGGLHPVSAGRENSAPDEMASREENQP
jgi:hypothetical protein